MLIDWFTVIAQAINFIILVWLMKRFLYLPILNAIDAREKYIAAELASADTKKLDAQIQQEKFQKNNDEFTQNRKVLLKQMNEEVEKERGHLLEEARNAADNLSKKRQENLKTDIENIYASIKSRTEKEVFEITKKVLVDLSTTTLEENIYQTFSKRLKELSPEVKKDFTDALKTWPAVLSSYSKLTEDQQTKLQRIIHDSFSSEVNIRFEVNPEIIAGIELTAHGKKISWSIRDYLDTMKKSLEDLAYEH